MPADECLITINGEARVCRCGQDVASLLQELGLNPEAVVVEINRLIITPDALGITPLNAGDQVELIHFVGGG